VDSSTKRKPGKRLIVLSIVLLVLCQSQQLLALGGLSLFLPLIRQNVGLDFTQGGTLGAVKDATGSFDIGLYSIAGLCLFALVCTLLLARMKPVSGREAATVRELP
jgi:hypothetical protein